MTNRIKELMPKAYELQRQKHGGYFTQELLLEAFAEMIVKEAYEIVIKSPEISTSLAGKRMLEHFGVE